MSDDRDTEIAYLSAGEELTIYTAAQQKEDLLSQLQAGQGLEIDLSQVQEIDSSGIQVLMLLKREADEKHKALHLANHSQSVVEAFELLDLAGFFGDPVVIPAEWQKK